MGLSQSSNVIDVDISLSVLNSSKHNRLEYAGGSYYEGSVQVVRRKRIKHGFGALSVANDGVYFGSWDNDSLHGSGGYVSEEEQYQGEYQRGLRHGIGFLSTSRGIRAGLFYKNVRCGTGIVLNERGVIFHEFISADFRADVTNLSVANSSVPFDVLQMHRWTLEHVKALTTALGLSETVDPYLDRLPEKIKRQVGYYITSGFLTSHEAHIHFFSKTKDLTATAVIHAESKHLLNQPHKHSEQHQRQLNNSIHPETFYQDAFRSQPSTLTFFTLLRVLCKVRRIVSGRSALTAAAKLLGTLHSPVSATSFSDSLQQNQPGGIRSSQLIVSSSGRHYHHQHFNIPVDRVLSLLRHSLPPATHQNLLAQLSVPSAVDMLPLKAEVLSADTIRCVRVVGRGGFGTVFRGVLVDPEKAVVHPKSLIGANVTHALMAVLEGLDSSEREGDVQILANNLQVLEDYWENLKHLEGEEEEEGQQQQLCGPECGGHGGTLQAAGTSSSSSPSPKRYDDSTHEEEDDDTHHQRNTTTNNTTRQTLGQAFDTFENLEKCMTSEGLVVVERRASLLKQHDEPGGQNPAAILLRPPPPATSICPESLQEGGNSSSVIVHVPGADSSNDIGNAPPQHHQQANTTTTSRTATTSTPLQPPPSSSVPPAILASESSTNIIPPPSVTATSSVTTATTNVKLSLAFASVGGTNTPHTTTAPLTSSEAVSVPLPAPTPSSNTQPAPLPITASAPYSTDTNSYDLHRKQYQQHQQQHILKHKQSLLTSNTLESPPFNLLPSPLSPLHNLASPPHHTTATSASFQVNSPPPCSACGRLQICPVCQKRVSPTREPPSSSFNPSSPPSVTPRRTSTADGSENARTTNLPFPLPTTTGAVPRNISSSSAAAADASEHTTPQMLHHSTRTTSKTLQHLVPFSAPTAPPLHLHHHHTGAGGGITPVQSTSAPNNICTHHHHHPTPTGASSSSVVLLQSHGTTVSGTTTPAAAAAVALATAAAESSLIPLPLHSFQAPPSSAVDSLSRVRAWISSSPLASLDIEDVRSSDTNLLLAAKGHMASVRKTFAAGGGTSGAPAAGGTPAGGQHPAGSKRRATMVPPNQLQQQQQQLGGNKSTATQTNGHTPGKLNWSPAQTEISTANLLTLPFSPTGRSIINLNQNIGVSAAAADNQHSSPAQAQPIDRDAAKEEAEAEAAIAVEGADNRRPPMLIVSPPGRIKHRKRSGFGNRLSVQDAQSADASGKPAALHVFSESESHDEETEDDDREDENGEGAPLRVSSSSSRQQIGRHDGFCGFTSSNQYAPDNQEDENSPGVPDSSIASSPVPSSAKKTTTTSKSSKRFLSDTNTFGVIQVGVKSASAGSKILFTDGVRPDDDEEEEDHYEGDHAYAEEDDQYEGGHNRRITPPPAMQQLPTHTGGVPHSPLLVTMADSTGNAGALARSASPGAYPPDGGFAEADEEVEEEDEDAMEGGRDVLFDSDGFSSATSDAFNRKTQFSVQGEGRGSIMNGGNGIEFHVLRRRRNESDSEDEEINEADLPHDETAAHPYHHHHREDDASNRIEMPLATAGWSKRTARTESPDHYQSGEPQGSQQKQHPADMSPAGTTLLMRRAAGSVLPPDFDAYSEAPSHMTMSPQGQQFVGGHRRSKRRPSEEFAEEELSRLRRELGIMHHTTVVHDECCSHQQQHVLRSSSSPPLKSRHVDESTITDEEMGATGRCMHIVAHENNSCCIMTEGVSASSTRVQQHHQHKTTITSSPELSDQHAIFTCCHNAPPQLYITSNPAVSEHAPTPLLPPPSGSSTSTGAAGVIGYQPPSPIPYGPDGLPDLSTLRTVAVKVYTSTSTAALEDVIRELWISRGLVHPNLVRVHGISLYDGKHDQASAVDNNDTTAASNREHTHNNAVSEDEEEGTRGLAASSSSVVDERVKNELIRPARRPSEEEEASEPESGGELKSSRARSGGFRVRKNVFLERDSKLKAQQQAEKLVPPLLPCKISVNSTAAVGAADAPIVFTSEGDDFVTPALSPPPAAKETSSSSPKSPSAASTLLLKSQRTKEDLMAFINPSMMNGQRFGSSGSLGGGSTPRNALQQLNSSSSLGLLGKLGSRGFSRGFSGLLEGIMSLGRGSGGGLTTGHEGEDDEDDGTDLYEECMKQTIGSAAANGEFSNTNGGSTAKKSSSRGGKDQYSSGVLLATGRSAPTIVNHTSSTSLKYDVSNTSAPLHHHSESIKRYREDMDDADEEEEEEAMSHQGHEDDDDESGSLDEHGERRSALLKGPPSRRFNNSAIFSSDEDEEDEEDFTSSAQRHSSSRVKRRTSGSSQSHDRHRHARRHTNGYDDGGDLNAFDDEEEDHEYLAQYGIIDDLGDHQEGEPYHRDAASSSRFAAISPHSATPAAFKGHKRLAAALLDSPSNSRMMTANQHSHIFSASSSPSKSKVASIVIRAAIRMKQAVQRKLINNNMPPTSTPKGIPITSGFGLSTSAAQVSNNNNGSVNNNVMTSSTPVNPSSPRRLRRGVSFQASDHHHHHHGQYRPHQFYTTTNTRNSVVLSTTNNTAVDRQSIAALRAPQRRVKGGPSVDPRELKQRRPSLPPLAYPAIFPNAQLNTSAGGGGGAVLPPATTNQKKQANTPVTPPPAGSPLRHAPAAYREKPGAPLLDGHAASLPNIPIAADAGMTDNKVLEVSLTNSNPPPANRLLGSPSLIARGDSLLSCSWVTQNEEGTDNHINDDDGQRSFSTLMGTTTKQTTGHSPSHQQQDEDEDEAKRISQQSMASPPAPPAFEPPHPKTPPRSSTTPLLARWASSNEEAGPLDHDTDQQLLLPPPQVANGTTSPRFVGPPTPPTGEMGVTSRLASPAPSVSASGDGGGEGASASRRRLFFHRSKTIPHKVEDTSSVAMDGSKTQQQNIPEHITGVEYLMLRQQMKQESINTITGGVGPSRPTSSSSILASSAPPSRPQTRDGRTGDERSARADHDLDGDDSNTVIPVPPPAALSHSMPRLTPTASGTHHHLEEAPDDATKAPGSHDSNNNMHYRSSSSSIPSSSVVSKSLPNIRGPSGSHHYGGALMPPLMPSVMIHEEATSGRHEGTGHQMDSRGHVANGVSYSIPGLPSYTSRTLNQSISIAAPQGLISPPPPAIVTGASTSNKNAQQPPKYHQPIIFVTPDPLETSGQFSSSSNNAPPQQLHAAVSVSSGKTTSTSPPRLTVPSNLPHDLSELKLLERAPSADHPWLLAAPSKMIPPPLPSPNTPRAAAVVGANPPNLRINILDSLAIPRSSNLPRGQLLSGFAAAAALSGAQLSAVEEFRHQQHPDGKAKEGDAAGQQQHAHVAQEETEIATGGDLRASLVMELAVKCRALSKILVNGPLSVGDTLHVMSRVWDPLESTCRHASLSIL